MTRGLKWTQWLYRYFIFRYSANMQVNPPILYGGIHSGLCAFRSTLLPVGPAACRLQAGRGSRRVERLRGYLAGMMQKDRTAAFIMHRDTRSSGQDEWRRKKKRGTKMRPSPLLPTIRNKTIIFILFSSVNRIAFFDVFVKPTPRGIPDS